MLKGFERYSDRARVLLTGNVDSIYQVCVEDISRKGVQIKISSSHCEYFSKKNSFLLRVNFLAGMHEEIFELSKRWSKQNLLGFSINEDKLSNRQKFFLKNLVKYHLS